MKKIAKYLLGALIALVIAAAAKLLETWEASAGLHFIGASVIALFIGIVQLCALPFVLIRLFLHF